MIYTSESMPPDLVEGDIWNRLRDVGKEVVETIRWHDNQWVRLEDYDRLVFNADARELQQIEAALDDLPTTTKDAW